jgi:hypothetical protein
LAYVSLKDLISLFDFFIAALLHLLLHHCQYYYCLCYHYYASFFSQYSLNSLNGHHLFLALLVLIISWNPGPLHFFFLLLLKDWVASLHLILTQASN